MKNTYPFTRYLAAKKSVDDRALNQHVWNSLAKELSQIQLDRPIQILEIGAGIGTMIERMLERELLTHAHYTALDALPENIDHAMERLPEWAQNCGYHFHKLTRHQIEIKNAMQSISVDFKCMDLLDFLIEDAQAQKWDLLVAHAFLDLMDIPATLPQIFALLRVKGLFYFSINFDGVTLFEPSINPTLDENISALYHRTMDERRIRGKPSGDSRAGRHLFGYIWDLAGEILDAGASDWVVFPGAEGYPADEAFFLHFLIDTIHRALQGHPELEELAFTAWVAERHAQIERRELVYIAHQLDFLGRVGGKGDS